MVLVGKTSHRILLWVDGNEIRRMVDVPDLPMAGAVR